MSHYCRPSDIITDLVTPTLTAGAAAAAFPLANLKDRKAHTVFKSTGTGATIQWAFGVSKTLQAVAIINHNLTGATVNLDNNGGMAQQTITIPATPEDGHRLDPWKSLVGVANNAASTWTLTVTGAATVVAIGEVLLIQTLREILFPWGVVELGEEHKTIIHETDYGTRMKYGMGVRQRRIRGRIDLEEYRADLVALQRDARGPLRNFALMQDWLADNVNDCLYVDLTTDIRRYLLDKAGFTLVDLEFTEAQKGLALA